MSILSPVIPAMLSAAVLSAILSGCYQYAPPDPVLEGETFTRANRTKSDQLLDSADVLTLAMACDIAEENNQSYLAAGHAVNAAKMRYYQSFGAFMPEITAGAAVGQNLKWNNNRVNPPTDMPGRDYTFQTMTGVSASWLIFDGLARELNMLIQERGVKREEATRMRIICMIKRAVAYAYEDIQYALAVEAIQAANRDYQETLLKIVEPEFRRKLRPEDEVANFKVQGGYAAAALVEARYQRDVSNYALSQLMGYPEGELPGSPKLSPPDTRIRPLPFTVDVALDLALQNNPAMHIMEQTLKIAEYNKFKSYSSYVPTFSAYSDFTYAAQNSHYQQFMHSSSSSDGPGFSYGIRAEYLIFNGFARYNMMREMQAAYAMTRYDMAETYLQTVNDTRSAYANYLNRAEQAKIYRSISDAAKLQRNLVRERYLRYDVSVDRLNETQTFYVNTELAYAQEINLLNKALAQLEAILMVPIFPDSPVYRPRQ